MRYIYKHTHTYIHMYIHIYNILIYIYMYIYLHTPAVAHDMYKDREWKMFQPSTICKGSFGTKIMFFTYGFTTFIGKKFIDSCSLGLPQMTVKLYRSPERNKDYKAIPSLLLPHPSRGRHTSLPPTLSRPSSVQKMRYAGLNLL